MAKSAIKKFSKLEKQIDKRKNNSNLDHQILEKELKEIITSEKDNFKDKQNPVDNAVNNYVQNKIQGTKSVSQNDSKQTNDLSIDKNTNLNEEQQKENSNPQKADGKNASKINIQKKLKRNNKKKQKKSNVLNATSAPVLRTVIPKAYPKELTVLVSKLPKNFKRVDIIDTFSKYGTITYLQSLSKRSVVIAFLNQEEADAAFKANRMPLNGFVIKVQKRVKSTNANYTNDKNADRTVIVGILGSETSEADVRSHFKDCGEIESVKFTKKRFAIIVFDNADGGQAALKKHNTILNDTTINVRLKSIAATGWDMKKTIVLKNIDHLKKIEGSVITDIFSKCGSIEKCDVLCYKHKLALIAFKEEDSVTKALSLNNSNHEGINIEVHKYSAEIEKSSVPMNHDNQSKIWNKRLEKDMAKDNGKKNQVQNFSDKVDDTSVPMKNDNYSKILEQAKENKRKVCIKRLGKDMTEDDVRSLFESCGPIKSVEISPTKFCKIEFESSEGYCKAFTLHGLQIGGLKLSLKPFCERKLMKDKRKTPVKRKAYKNQIEFSEVPGKRKK